MATTKVVTYQTAADQRINICPRCAERLRTEGNWPRTAQGEYCQVHRGLHAGECDLCAREDD